MGQTKIEWAERVWNPVTGCTPVSEGCANCYAKRQAKWLRRMKSSKYLNATVPRTRLKYLKECQAAYKFLSLEPLLGPIALAAADWDWHEYIDLVIVGGESGPGARPMNPEWAQDIRDDCIHLNVPFCFKQWGGVNKKKAGRMLDGEIHDGKIDWRV